MTSQHCVRALAQTVKPFSKLFISPSYAKVTYKIVEPELKLNEHLNDEYLEKIKQSLILRNYTSERNGLNDQINFNKFKDQLKELLNRKERLLKYVEGDKRELANEERKLIYNLEEQVIPIVLRLPNLFDETEVPTEGYDDRILKQSKIKMHNFKLLDCKRISYINGLRKSSILGPHCEYLIGKGALIHLALQKYFKKSIENAFPESNTKKVYRNLHEVDGLDLIKSALIEAANDYDQLNYKTDTRRLDLQDSDEQQQLHLVGSCSKESLLSLLIKRRIDEKYLPARFVQYGSTYEQNLKQVNTICMFNIVKNDFNVSNDEFKKIETLIWDLYKELNLPIRLRRLNVKKLHFNEYNRVELDVYFPYSRDWKTIGHFAHYSDYLTTRVHSTDHHCLGGYLTDFSLLLDAILENNQTETGQLIVPECIENLM